MNTSKELPIEIRLDEAPLCLKAGITLAGLIDHLNREPAGVATALNGDFVPRDARHLTVLKSGDQVLLFKPIVGG